MNKITFLLLITNMIFSIPVEITKLEELEKIQNGNLSILLTYPKSDEQELKRLNKISSSYENIEFFFTTSNELKESLKINDKYGLVIFRNFDSGTKMMTNEESFNLQMMKGFIEKFKNPLVRELTEKLIEEIFEHKKNVIVFFINSKDDENYEDFKNSAKNNLDFFFVYSFLNENDTKFSEFFSIEAPCLRILEFGEKGLLKYKIEHLQEGIEDFKNKKLNPYYRSQKESKDEGLIKIVTGNNFEDMILKRKKNVILFVYAPWMDNFDEFSDTYNKVIENLKDNEDIIFSKMDITQNEYPSLLINNLPSLFLFKLGEEKVLENEKEFNLENILSFVEKNLNEHYMENKEL